jgi:hypothetical protein
LFPAIHNSSFLDFCVFAHVGILVFQPVVKLQSLRGGMASEWRCLNNLFLYFFKKSLPFNNSFLDFRHGPSRMSGYRAIHPQLFGFPFGCAGLRE